MPQLKPFAFSPKKGRFSAPVVFSNKFGSPNPFVHFSVSDSYSSSSPTKFILGNKKKETRNNLSVLLKTWRKIFIITGMFFVFILIISWLRDVNFINSFMEVFNHCLEIINGYQSLLSAMFSILSLLVILFIWSWKTYDLKTLVVNSIKFRLIICAVAWTCICIWGNAIPIYVLLYTLIVYSFIISDKKKEIFYKLVFILSFWYLFYASIIMACNLDISVLIGLFLANYVLSEFDLYSNIDPVALKYIFDNLHNMLKELNWKPPKKNPFSLFHIPDNDMDKETTFTTNTGNTETNQQPISNYEYLFIPFIINNVNVYNLGYPLGLEYDEVLENDQFRTVRDKIDIHNNSLKHLEKKDFFSEKNIIDKKLANNNYVDSIFHNSSCLYYDNYTIRLDQDSNVSYSYNLVKENFLFFKLAAHIFDEIATYNKLMAAKLYYENEISENKKDLPDEFKKAWDRFYVANTSYILKNVNHLTNYDEQIPNMLRKDLAYKEILDNILIVGPSILSLIHVQDNVYKDFLGPDNDIFDIQCIHYTDFFDKVWSHYEQSILKYYALFDMYNWHCKLYMLNEHSRADILNNDYFGYYHSVRDRYCGYENRPSIFNYVNSVPNAQDLMDEPLKVPKSIFAVKHDLKNFLGMKKFYTERESIFFKEAPAPLFGSSVIKHNVYKPITDLEKIFTSAKGILIKKVHYR